MTKERPILFSAPMVRAILEGRKSQTRRVMKHQEYIEADDDGGFIHAHKPSCQGLCDYDCHRQWAFEVGMSLWVKETWGRACDGDNIGGIVYRATDPDWDSYENWKWRPSIFMPRVASRLTLNVTEVRVERLHAITEADAKIEGLPAQTCVVAGDDAMKFKHRNGFINLWCELNGLASWDANPWVWVVSFRRAKTTAFTPDAPEHAAVPNH